MTYRQLQIALKAARNAGRIPTTFRLNQKKVILQAEYDRLISTPITLAPQPQPETKVLATAEQDFNLIWEVNGQECTENNKKTGGTLPLHLQDLYASNPAYYLI